ncbi:MAG: TetR family transcriptional regulator C-terminal domain-containing protein [Acholeplasmatales bacterium]|nr:TetR family transcriptional regulator C-terminal domain-containing protein [Acholeplasmatales bacterium]
MDKRVVRTRESIVNALLKLMTEKSTNKITVSEITNIAQIERKTFYLHYSCIDDVFHDLENQIAKELEQEANKYIDEPSNKMTDIFNNLNKVILNNLSFFKAIIKNDTYSYVLHSFEHILSNVIYKLASEKYEVKSKNLSYYTMFYAAGIVKLYTEWLKGQTKITLEELTTITTRVCFLSVNELANY